MSTTAAPTVPALRLEAFFAGRTRCWGLFEDRFGHLRRQFVIDLEGRWDGRALTLEEDYRYDDGETGRRIWTIVPVGEHAYEGRSDDVLGVARGSVAGNRFRWRYAMKIRMGERFWRFDFDDSLVLQPDGVLLNRAYMSRFGLGLGSVTAVFQRWDPRAEAMAA